MMAIADHSLDPTGSASARRDLIVRSLAVVLPNPKVWLLGVGLANFQVVSIHDGATHNSYLQVLTEVGVPGLLFYGLFMVAAWKATGRVLSATAGRREMRTIFVLGVALRASLCAYAVGSLFASVAYLWYLYYPAGLAVCLRDLVESACRPVAKRA
jgi:threonine/homoserine/homoserine lactone efflux protein